MDAGRINTAIDLLAAMVVDEIALEENRDPSDILSEFFSSDTAKMLYDESCKMWWDGPSEIVDCYRKEEKNLLSETE